MISLRIRKLNFWMTKAAIPLESLKRGRKWDVVVTVPRDLTVPYVPSSATPEITVRVDELRDSNGAYIRVNKMLTDARLRLSEKRISGFGIESPWLKTLHFSATNVENAARRSGAWLSLTLPITLVLLLLTGTLFPAIDLITGERERGHSACSVGIGCTARKHRLRKAFSCFLYRIDHCRVASDQFDFDVEHQSQ